MVVTVVGVVVVCVVCVHKNDAASPINVTALLMLALSGLAERRSLQIRCGAAMLVRLLLS